MSARKVKINKKTLYDLVREVQKRPCLWNTEYEYYNNRGHVAIAWDEITNIMSLPEAMVRAKWKNMRDLLKRETKKFNYNTIKEYTKAGGRWKHIKVMWFLHKPSVIDQVTVNDSSTTNESTTEVAIKEEEDPTLTNALGFNDCDNHINTFNSNVFQIEEFQPDPLPNNKLTSEEDYDMMFLKSLAPYFRELDPVRKLKLRNKIQDIILSEISAQRAYGVSTH